MAADRPHVLIVGGGGGGALAHDLTQRGMRVTLLERGELLSGASGRHHGLLHSGARYVLHDPEAAAECREENAVLRRIAPQAIEANGGLFVAVDEQDLSYRDAFLEGCRAAGIPVEVVPASQARAMEPALTPEVRAAIAVPDGVVDAWRLAMHFFATARAGGADIRRFTEVVALVTAGRSVTGVEAVDHRTNRKLSIAADLVVNAAGPWAGRVAAMAGVDIPLQPAPGVMLSVRGRLTNRVVNRLQPAGEGDIVVPQRMLTILGTTAWLSDEPDPNAPPPGHAARLIELCGRLVPALKGLAPHAVWCAGRPLLLSGAERDPFRISRTFDCIDHAARDGVEGLVTLIGGKATTMRAMAERTADLVCRKTGFGAACRTRETALLPHRGFWK
jgi:glycerol-3-phosphate dehydrogenase